APAAPSPEPEEDGLAARAGEDLPPVEAGETAADRGHERVGPAGPQAAAGDVHGVPAEVAAEEGVRGEGEEHVVEQGRRVGVEDARPAAAVVLAVRSR
ncbi:hypothetical protein THAOC_22627, partial [Thalassiosira oceanica]